MKGSLWSAVFLLTIIVQVPMFEGPLQGLVNVDSQPPNTALMGQNSEQWQLAGNTACNPRAQICDRVDEGPQR